MRIADFCILSFRNNDECKKVVTSLVFFNIYHLLSVGKLNFYITHY